MYLIISLSLFVGKQVNVAKREKGMDGHLHRVRMDVTSHGNNQ